MELSTKDIFDILSDEEKDVLIKSQYEIFWSEASCLCRQEKALFVRELNGIQVLLPIPDSVRNDILTILMTAYGEKIKEIEDKYKE